MGLCSSLATAPVAQHLGVADAKLLVYVTRVCAKRTSAATSVKRRRHEPDGAISPKCSDLRVAAPASRQSFGWCSLAHSASACVQYIRHPNFRCIVTCPAQYCIWLVCDHLLRLLMMSRLSLQFVCTEPGCNATFTQKSSLTYHLRVHANERPFVCDYPGMADLLVRTSITLLYACISALCMFKLLHCPS